MLRLCGNSFTEVDDIGNSQPEPPEPPESCQEDPPLPPSPAGPTPHRHCKHAGTRTAPWTQYHANFVKRRLPYAIRLPRRPPAVNKAPSNTEACAAGRSRVDRRERGPQTARLPTREQAPFHLGGDTGAVTRRLQASERPFTSHTARREAQVAARQPSRQATARSSITSTTELALTQPCSTPKLELPDRASPPLRGPNRPQTAMIGASSRAYKPNPAPRTPGYFRTVSHRPKTAGGVTLRLVAPPRLFETEGAKGTARLLAECTVSRVQQRGK